MHDYFVIKILESFTHVSRYYTMDLKCPFTGSSVPWVVLLGSGGTFKSWGLTEGDL
jgi:hypothetical protein